MRKWFAVPWLHANGMVKIVATALEQFNQTNDFSVEALFIYNWFNFFFLFVLKAKSGPVSRQSSSSRDNYTWPASNFYNFHKTKSSQLSLQITTIKLSEYKSWKIPENWAYLLLQKQGKFVLSVKISSSSSTTEKAPIIHFEARNCKFEDLRHLHKSRLCGRNR